MQNDLVKGLSGVGKSSVYEEPIRVHGHRLRPSLQLQRRPRKRSTHDGTHKLTLDRRSTANGRDEAELMSCTKIGIQLVLREYARHPLSAHNVDGLRFLNLRLNRRLR